jgi:glycosyltransferase involved in cell wall biosynthesis
MHIPNPFDPSNFKFERGNENNFSMLWVRAFDEIYQPELAIHILFELCKKYPETHLTMIGPDHGKKSDVIKLINKLNLISHVTIVGPVNNLELGKYYQSHKVYINTTRYESFGVSLIEAASCGIPIVSNPVGEIPLLWEHGMNILLADLNNPIDFASKVEHLFTDRIFYNRLLENARILTTQFHWEKLELKWLNLLK